MYKITYMNEISPNVIDMKIHAPLIAKDAKPGQFLHINCGPSLLRRPISICDCEGEIVRFVFQIKGEGTRELSEKKIGDDLDVLGPLGNGFDLEKDGKSLVVGGGIGIFPLLMLAKKLDNPTAILGFKSKENVCFEDELRAVCKDVLIATNDGSYGYTGFVTDFVEADTKNIFACGPKPMLRSIKNVAESIDADCEVSLEERMGCGIGACVVCTCKTTWGKNARVCKDGPVFDAKSVDLTDDPMPQVTSIEREDCEAPDLSVNIAGVVFKNPIIPASGTFGNGREFADYYDLSELGGITVKALSMQERLGNKTPRIAETPMGMLNSVGLQNNGIEYFMQIDLPFLKQFNTKIIANISGHTIEENVQLAAKLGDSVDMLELNISCPNVTKGGAAFGVDPLIAGEITRAVAKVAKVPLIVKLSPNVTSIAEIAKAVEQNGANAVSLINTVLGMRIDVKTMKPVLYNNVGGLSGPCVKPIGVRMVWQVANAVNIPIIGMGGVSTGEDVVEYMLAGATGVGVGTANLVDPMACINIKHQLTDYLVDNKIKSASSLIKGVCCN